MLRISAGTALVAADRCVFAIGEFERDVFICVGGERREMGSRNISMLMNAGFVCCWDRCLLDRDVL